MSKSVGRAGTPMDERARFRAGARQPTAGLAPGYAQANLIAVPGDLAGDLRLFAERNPKPCPLLDMTAPGEVTTRLADDADLRTDLPAYRIWERGRCVAEVTDATPYWRDDLVAFLVGCSFTFEAALVEAGVPVRHVELGRNVPMYRTNRACQPAGRFSGPLVVSMRPVPAPLVELAVEVTGRYPAVHGSPVHIGDPAKLGIVDLAQPDFGDPVPVHDGEVPVFWACGVTLLAVVMASRPPFAISHAPGHMFVTDVPDSAYLVSAPLVGVPDLSAPGGRRARQGFTYRAYIPDQLDPEGLTFSAVTAADIADAEAAVAVANHGQHLVPMGTLARLLLRSESVASSRIEGLECNQRRLAEAAFAPEHASYTARQVLANIDAMRQAIGLGAANRDLTVGDVKEMHGRLMREDRATGRFAGEFRTQQNWIGGRSDSPRDAAYVPPPPEYVEPLMHDLVAFVNRDELPTLAQAAIAHAQFETIHPFLDGNGRVGRCLIHTVLARRQLASRMLVPVSLVLAAYGDHYIQGLVDFREGHIDQWCGTFASATRLAIDGAARFEEELATMITRWRFESEARPDSHLWRACEQTTIAPVFTVTSLRDELRCSTTAATEAIERLGKIGIVAQVSLGKRNRVYLNRAVLRLLDDFERDLLTGADGKPGRLRTSAQAKTAVPAALLPSIEHAVLESFPLGTDAPPETGAIARISGYRSDQVRHVLDRFAGEGLLDQVDARRWILTAKGRRLRAMLRAGEDLRGAADSIRDRAGWAGTTTEGR